MSKREERIVSLEEAISQVKDGDRVGLSGSVLFHQPVALTRALIRRGVKDLTLVMLCGGIASDMLIGAGCVKKVVATMMGMQEYAPVLPFFRDKFLKGEIEYWECDFQQWHCSMKAAQWGMPCLYTKAGLGTDITKINPDLKEVELSGQKWIAVPPNPIDVALIYAHKVDPYGNAIYNGMFFAEHILATAARRAIIISAEEIVPNEVMRRDPRVVILGGPWRGDYVVEIPYGAHPDEGHGYYMHDGKHIREYVAAARATVSGENPRAFQKYLEKYVYGPKTQAEYLEAVGGITRLLDLRQSMV